MKIKLNILLLLIPLIGVTSKVKFGKNLDFEVIKATKQTIVGGVYGSPMVTNYTLNLKALRTFTIVTDSGYAEGKIDNLNITNDSNQIVKKAICKKGKSYVLYFSIITPIETNSNFPSDVFVGSREQKIPIKSSTGILMRYKGGKSKYLVLSKIVTNETVYAP
ncbi:MAG: hypothetical protein HQ463_00535 [Bacteroidetes bacterium]|nr:hypothetical protein [Bacteroidota bacterium]